MTGHMHSRDPKGPLRRKRRAVLWSVLIMLVGAFALPVAGSFVFTGAGTTAVQAAAKQETNPRANYWRAVREGDEGYTAASGAYTTNVLVQNGGENYRSIRNGPVASIAPWFLALIILAIGLYHFLRGPQKLEEPLSGRTMERWSLGERVMHWYVAILFIVLGITGLSVFFSRAVLVPVIGLHANAAYLGLAKDIHNYIGPFFMVGVIIEIVVWARYNIFTKDDIDWLKRIGGMFGGRHPHAARTNGGEKVWFWIIATVGLIGVCVTGIILDFPNFGQTRETMQLTQLLHGVFAMVWIGVALGHIYLAIWGTPGSLEGMTSGYVTEEWMKHHHDRWYEEMKSKGYVGTERPAGEAPARAS